MNFKELALHVHGIRFRTRKDPLDDVSERQDTEPLSRKALDTKSPENPYALVYGLLYPPPDEFAASQLPKYELLYPYQKQGVAFLVNRDHALLADDMGLGKTAQCSIAIAVLHKSERLRRALIICPRAVIRQWEHEALQWAGIYARPVDGSPSARKLIWERMPGVLLATPNIVQRDIEAIEKAGFDLVVCDDVSMLKNPGKITTAIRRIPTPRSWCLSGTPLENKPEDFVNVMEFVTPGLFVSPERRYAPSRTEIQSRVAPYFLRRRKIDVLPELPEKQLIGPIELDLSDEQRKEYTNVESARWEELQTLGVKLTKIHVFALINQLIQLCNFHKASGASAKAEAIGEDLAIILDDELPENRAIVFSRYVETLRYLEKRYEKHKPLVYYGGLSNSERARILAEFKSSGRLLLMSTKAGSRGLNLQEASYVFHFDRTWNPVDELQAEDRCWRMGQRRNVSVYRYLQLGTIEERIHEVLTQKRSLFDRYVDSMVEDSDALAAEHWTLDELVSLLRPTAKKVA